MVRVPDTGLDRFTDLFDDTVCIVTAQAGGERAGCLVGFAGQCSIRPPRFVVWLSRLNHTFRVAGAAESLAVHVVDRGGLPLAELFGGETGDRVDKFARVAWRPAADGTPLLDGACAWFVGRITARVDGGDHVGFLLDPVEQSPDPDPLPDLLTLHDVWHVRAGHPA